MGLSERVWGVCSEGCEGVAMKNNVLDLMHRHVLRSDDHTACGLDMNQGLFVLGCDCDDSTCEKGATCPGCLAVVNNRVS